MASKLPADVARGEAERPDAAASSCRKWRREQTRLLRRKDYLRVQQNGRRFRGSTMTLILLPQARLPAAAGGLPAPRGRCTPPLASSSAPAPGRWGLTVSRKVGNAVQRNRVRRVLREAWRLGEQPLLAVDHVIIAFAEARTLTLAGARQELACLLAKARRWAPPPSCATGL